jgi:hypothetical protein
MKKDSKKRKAARKLVLQHETIKRLSSPKLDDIAGGVVQIGGGPRTVAEFSGGPVCTGGIACTFNWTCSHGCK